MKILSVILLVIVLSSFVYGAEPSREGDIVKFCSETRDYCTQETKKFSVETERVINQRALEFKDAVHHELRIFKFTQSVALFFAILAAFSINEILRGRREFKRQKILMKMAKEQGLKVPVPRPPKTFIKGAFYFLAGLSVSLFVGIITLWGFGFIG